MTHDLLPQLDRICNFIHSHRGSDISYVLVHCDKGVSRSATSLVVYLMRTHQWSYDTTLAFVKKKRQIQPNKNFEEQLD